MVYTIKGFEIDCTFKKCRVNGRVMHKFELAHFMRDLDFERFYYKYLYFEVFSYSEIYSDLLDYCDEYVEKLFNNSMVA